MGFFIRKYTNTFSAYFCCVLVTFSLSYTAYASEHIELAFGLYASDKPTSLVKKFRPILNVLEKDLSVRLNKQVSIKLNIAKTYKDGMKNLVDGKVDFARFGPASYIIAREQNPGISLLAMETKKGKKHFKGVICVRTDSPIRKLTDLKAKRFAFGNKHSTIGRYLSQQHLLQHGVRSRDFTKYEYLGRHDNVGYAVALGKYDAGALKESTLKKLIRQGQSLRPIASFKNVTKPWVAREGLNKNIHQALQAALLHMTNNETLIGIKKDGFTLATHRDYLPVEKAIKNNKAFFK